MTRFTTRFGRIARRLALLAVPLFVAATGTAAAMGGSYGGGTMGGWGWGLLGGAMGLWGLLWMGVLVAVPLYLVGALARRRGDGPDDRPLSVLRERYARGDLPDEEFEARRERLERVE